MEEEEIQSSKFNAGVAQTYRVNDILNQLNFCKLNPLAWNGDRLDWNYNLVFKCIENLYGEVEGFLTDTESKEVIELYEKIRELIKKYPIHENKRRPNIYNVKNYECTLQLLGLYERKVKRLGTKYKLLVAFEKKAGRI